MSVPPCVLYVEAKAGPPWPHYGDPPGFRAGFRRSRGDLRRAIGGSSLRGADSVRFVWFSCVAASFPRVFLAVFFGAACRWFSPPCSRRAVFVALRRGFCKFFGVRRVTRQTENMSKRYDSEEKASPW
jgi:hypothetical protein